MQFLNDMTLLGVGAGAGSSGAATTLGGIGSGYIYAALERSNCLHNT